MGGWQVSIRSMKRLVRKSAGMCLVCGEDSQPHSLYCRDHTRNVMRAKPSFAAHQSFLQQQNQTSAKRKNY